MKRITLTIITVFSMCCLVACGGEKTDNTNASNKSEPVMTEAPVNNAEITPAPVEVTPEPTAEPITEEVPEATKGPSANYEGIDMESDLSGAEWIETFVGVIDEPKIVVYNNETGRKQIVEMKEEVVVNPDTDIVAIYLPDGYKIGSKTAGLVKEKSFVSDHSESYILDSEETRNAGSKLVGISYQYDGEEKFLKFTIMPE